MLEDMGPCGVLCTCCEYYPAECPGCAAIRGKAFWLAYTGGEVCAIYHCCVEEQGRPHCGGCGQLPCTRYDLEDPTRSHEDNEAGQREQLKRLRSVARRTERVGKRMENPARKFEKGMGESE